MLTDSWLAQTASLLECQQFEQLLAQFLESLCEVLCLDNYLFVAPTIDGRQLAPLACHRLCPAGFLAAATFQVTDFSHPLSHVLQSGKPMLLDGVKRMYWREHGDFAELMAALEADQTLLIYPLINEGNVIAILCLAVSQAQGNELLLEKSWQQYAGVFIRHWQLLNKVQSQVNSQSQLTESIALMRHQQQAKQAMETLESCLVGRSEPMQAFRQQLFKSAQSDLSVMIQGETGTGKELAARAVHDHSKRCKQPFVAINCAAIPESLLESELFGYAKGAFSGADQAKQGLIAQADKGTLFLDEIGDMPLNLQSKLLRVLETGCFRALGSSQEIHADFRLVAATHVNLKQESDQGNFRRDLYYRLYQFPLALPPLRERRTDIAQLAKHFIERFNCAQRRHIPGIRFSALSRLNQHSFPGNVRELRNFIEYACAQTFDDVEIDESALPEFDIEQLPEQPRPAAVNDDGYDDISNLKEAVADFERAVIRHRLRTFDRDRAKVAMSLNMPVRTLNHKCKKLEINE